ADGEAVASAGGVAHGIRPWQDRRTHRTTEGTTMSDQVFIFIAAANARTSVLWIEILSAAGADPVIAEALEALLARRMADYRTTVQLLIDRGIAPADTDIPGAAAALSFLWSPEGHQQLVLQSGWSMPRYTAWLCDAARRQLA
ncbi:MAG TPA: hypothetical protein VN041_00765, partial [Microbacterium sp.]|nr:hypothetical protein [Microbacterium sp.]